MRKTCLLTCAFLFFHCLTTYAQDVTIIALNNDSIPMAYAHILLNSKPVAVCDTMGKAIIPAAILSDNDTIGVSSLGAEPVFVLYDKSLKESKEYCFYMNETVYAMDELVVVYLDPEKLFRKSIKNISEINYNCSMTARLDADVISSDSCIRNVSGTIVADNELWSEKFPARRYGWFHHPLTFSTESDTGNISNIIDLHAHFVLNLINRSLFYSRQHLLTTYRPVYSFLGVEDEQKVFRISYPQMHIVGCPYQILLNVDRQSGYITSVEIAAVNTDPEKNTLFSMINLKYDCRLFTNKKPRMNTVYLPDNIQYRAVMEDGSVVEFKISEVSIQNKKF